MRVNLFKPLARIALFLFGLGFFSPNGFAAGQETFEFVDWNGPSQTVRSCLIEELRSFSPTSSAISVYAPKPSRRVNFNLCCRGASVSRELPGDWKVASNPIEDIYAAGAEWDQGVLEHSTRFDFSIPSTVGEDVQLPIRDFDTYPPELDRRALIDVSLEERGISSTSSVSFLDSGGFSDVYRVKTRDAPTEVIKVRRENSKLDLIEAGLRRDLSLEKVATELAARARYDGKPFVRVEPWISTPAELQRGVIRQRAVEGPKVWELAQAVEEWERLGNRAKNTLSESDRLRLSSAEAVLNRAQLSASEAKDRIVALEDFYRNAHDPVLAFCAENRINPVYNKKKNGVIAVVGLDYNSGRNAAWDPDSRQFVIFDW